MPADDNLWLGQFRIGQMSIALEAGLKAQLELRDDEIPQFNPINHGPIEPLVLEPFDLIPEES